jgi:MFS family permease
MPGQHFDRKWWTLLASCIAIFMLLLDVTIVNVALPSIERSLGADFSDLQWVIDAYALTLAGYALVRSREFVGAAGPASAPPEPEPARA